MQALVDGPWDDGPVPRRPARFTAWPRVSDEGVIKAEGAEGQAEPQKRPFLKNGRKGPAWMNGYERVLAMIEGRPADHLPNMPITMMFAGDQIGPALRPLRPGTIA